MFGVFHIAALAASVLLAAAGSRAAASGAAACAGMEPGTMQAETEKGLVSILFRTGLVLALMEAAKQTYIAARLLQAGIHSYDWWYFPFQLCSVPMYMCLLLPLTSGEGRLRRSLLAFMESYTLISACAALIWPEDYLKASLPLAVHGFNWHGILLFISLLIIRMDYAALSFKGPDFFRAAGIFALLSLAAASINAASEPLMAGAHTGHGYAAMFYMNPYHISPQPIVSSVQSIIGIPAGLVLYALAVTAASGAAFIVISMHHNSVTLKC